MSLMVRREELDLCFEKLMVFGGGGGAKMGGGGAITEWKDIPMELLLRIVSLVDDRTVIVVSRVCSGWRDAICWGLTQLSLSRYRLSLSLVYLICNSASVAFSMNTMCWFVGLIWVICCSLAF